jgi:hypothetical protein
MHTLSRLLQRGIFHLSFGRVAGRRSGIHGSKRRMDPAMERVKFLVNCSDEKATGAEEIL